MSPRKKKEWKEENKKKQQYNLNTTYCNILINITFLFKNLPFLTAYFNIILKEDINKNKQQYPGE